MNISSDLKCKKNLVTNEWEWIEGWDHRCYCSCIKACKSDGVGFGRWSEKAVQG
ncbi:hypothetical protein N657DRAFT_715820 [Parathielavia appendiculata]|uniref:Uncharacterized protein n=1 Tax=Parathielavia appendiculata TaxID=2587402 RepID=A0AAN6YYG2_9PEZI|nr:hypothetical protein N657DRAFT_715820 [Parathielavia appendiculata]